MPSLQLESAAFKNNEMILAKYTCDGENVIPPFKISSVPEEAKSLALIMDDPDAPTGTFTHWVIWNIPPETKEIKEGIPPEGIAGISSNNKARYVGPCPPSGTHRYFFKLYALDNVLNISEGSDKGRLQKAMSGHILD